MVGFGWYGGFFGFEYVEYLVGDDEFVDDV